MRQPIFLSDRETLEAWMENNRNSKKNEPQEWPVRLNKYLSQMGICSRREADRLIEEGKVLVDSVTAKPGTKVEQGQKVVVSDREVAFEKQEMILLAVNKPRGVVCTTDRRFGDRLLEDLVICEKRVFSIGRLDKDSEGLILMTNNGEILNKIMRARNYHEKEYIVKTDKPVTEEFLAKMAGGVPILDTVTRPCKVWKTGERRFHIILTQGLNRQIRRMCEACGFQVVRLKRIRVMNIELGDLKTGEFRELTQTERKVLLESLSDSEK